MKTNQNMVRKMGDFNVTQRTKDGMFNATNLLRQWNESILNTPNLGYLKKMDKFFDLKSTKEFITAIEQNSKDGDSPYLKTRGKYGGTWMHPYLFIDFAMWLNPTFKLQVIKFVYDELIKHRNLAGDNYRELCSAIYRIAPNCDFSKPAKWLNYVVFNDHRREIRNSATENQLNDLHSLEKKYADLISEQYITNIETLRAKLREEWRKRHAQVPI